MSMKNSKETIGNRTQDLPACKAVPQSIALPVPLRRGKSTEIIKDIMTINHN
jgi:hypothetical protein